MTAAEREAELARLTGKLNAIDLEIWLERRQIDRFLSRLGVLVKPTPKPRYRQVPVAARAEDSANPSFTDARLGGRGRVRGQAPRLVDELLDPVRPAVDEAGLTQPPHQPLRVPRLAQVQLPEILR